MVHPRSGNLSHSVRISWSRAGRIDWHRCSEKHRRHMAADYFWHAEQRYSGLQAHLKHSDLHLHQEQLSGNSTWTQYRLWHVYLTCDEHIWIMSPWSCIPQKLWIIKYKNGFGRDLESSNIGLNLLFFLIILIFFRFCQFLSHFFATFANILF